MTPELWKERHALDDLRPRLLHQLDPRCDARHVPGATGPGGQVRHGAAARPRVAAGQRDQPPGGRATASPIGGRDPGTARTRPSDGASRGGHRAAAADRWERSELRHLVRRRRQPHQSFPPRRGRRRRRQLPRANDEWRRGLLHQGRAERLPDRPRDVLWKRQWRVRSAGAVRPELRPVLRGGVDVRERGSALGLAFRQPAGRLLYLHLRQRQLPGLPHARRQLDIGNDLDQSILRQYFSRPAGLLSDQVPAPHLQAA